MNTIKFTVKQGQTEISYEGTPENLKEHFWEILDHLLTLPLWNAQEAGEEPAPSESMESAPTGERTIPLMTVNNVCAKLGVQNGPELVLASCVYLTYMRDMALLPRREILQTMKDATKFFKDTYASNLSSYLSSLIKQGSLMERSDGVFVLAPAVAEDLESRLA